MRVKASHGGSGEWWVWLSRVFYGLFSAGGVCGMLRVPVVADAFLSGAWGRASSVYLIY